MAFFRLQFPLLLTAIAGLVPIVSFFIDPSVGWVSNGRDRVERYMVIIASFAILLGVVNVVQSNIRKIERRQSGWPYGAFLLAGLFGMAIAGLAGAFQLFGLQGIGYTPDGGRTPFQWGTDFIFTPLQATMFSLLAFFMASAAFRAFRARNLEATILLVAAGVVMLGRIPLGESILGGRPYLSAFTDWLVNWPNAAAQRGIIIGAALGAASLSLRVITGIERSHLGLEKTD
ncbi:MAG: hypothetical protein ACE15D_05995 [Candidatus Eisenbacteria bacterium]|nr:hypothetical protein [Candidatus Eisenbacteria bacterium]